LIWIVGATALAAGLLVGLTGIGVGLWYGQATLWQSYQ
jgi:F0F1-type ATP synthase membrane subunit c/vacuolar-type H+-ATPase subunit K